MAREDAQLKFRITADLRMRLESEASKNGRSLNAEVTFRLEQHDYLLNKLEEFERANRDLAASVFEGSSKILELRDQLVEEQTRVMHLASELDAAKREQRVLREEAQRRALAGSDAVSTNTAQTLDAIIAEVRATRRLVEASNNEDIKTQLSRRYFELGNDKKAKAAYMQEMRDVLRLMEPHQVVPDVPETVWTPEMMEAHNLERRRRLRAELIAQRDEAARLSDSDIEETLDQSYPISADARVAESRITSDRPPEKQSQENGRKVKYRMKTQKP